HLAAERANDADRDSARQPEGVADGEDPLADLELVRVADGGDGEVGGAEHADHREVRRRVLADDLGVVLALVVEEDADARGPGDEVGVRDDVAARRDDDAAAGRAPEPARRAERVPLLELALLARGAPLGRRLDLDEDDGGRDAL